MNVRLIVVFVWEVLSLPAKKWTEAAESEEGHEKFLEKFYYPLLGIMALSIFLSALIKAGEFDFQNTLKRILVECITYFAGLYGAAYAVSFADKGFLKLNSSFSRIIVFVGMCYAPKLLIESLFEFLPSLGLNLLLWGVVIYSVWNASLYYFNSEKAKRYWCFIVLSILLLFIPALIRNLLLLIMPGLYC